MKFSQAPSSIVMVRPASFGSNPQTAMTNAFQSTQVISQAELSKKAIEEFDRMVDKLRAYDIDVTVVEDAINPAKPDSIFPNNWISFHEDGTVVLYPMLAPNRRLERSIPVLESIKSKFQVDTVLDFSESENAGKFLEGTGSIVFDYHNKIAYASRSARTDDSVFKDVCSKLGYKPVLFDAVDEQGLPIYHTNVLMCVGTHFTVLCLDAVKNDDDQEMLLNLMAETNHKVVAISYGQLRSFAGNMIEVKTQAGEPVVLPSDLRLFELVEDYMDHGLRYLTCTDIKADGMLNGPNFSLYDELRNRFPKLKITANGGISSIEDLNTLKKIGVDGAIIGKAIYEQKIKLEDLKSLVQQFRV